MQKIVFFYTCALLAGLSIITGLICIKYPSKIIAFQQYFYSKINWRIEPISMQKEIRNTKYMGLFLVLTGLLSFWFIKT